MKKIKRLSDEKRKAFKSKIIRSYTAIEEDGLGNIELYKEAAYSAMGIPYKLSDDKIYHHIGELDATSSVEALNALVDTYHLQRRPENRIFSYEHYIDACKRVGQIERQIEALSRWYQGPMTAAPPSDPADIDQRFVNAYNLRDYTPNTKGYLNYISSVATDLYYLAIKPLPFYMEENPDRPHGYVLGTTGSGKSELLKLLIHTYVTKPKYGSVVVIDPTSDFVTQIAKWKEFNASERLIYLRPTLAKGMTPVINPFEIEGIEATDYSEEALSIKIVVAQQLSEAFVRICTASFSDLMGTILVNSILILLDKKDATIEDLARLINNDPEQIQFASTLSHHDRLVTYFTSPNSGFNSQGNKSTKEAITRRLDELLSIGVFRKLTCGKSTIHLERAMNQRKVILLDLGKGTVGAKEGSAFGRLVIAMLLGIAYRREVVASKDRVPCSLIIDECHNFISESIGDILTEARKYRLFATLAQQTSGQKMPVELKDSVLQNTNLQAIGGTTPAGAKRNADMVGVTPEDIMKLTKGQFYVRPTRSLPAVKFKTREDLLGKRNCVNDLSWKRMVLEQVEKYYRHYDGSKKVVIEEEPDISPQKW